jgi:hypothetical protein
MLPITDGLASFSLIPIKDGLASSHNRTILPITDGLASASQSILKIDWPVCLHYRWIGQFEQYYPLQMDWPVPLRIDMNRELKTGRKCFATIYINGSKYSAYR